MASFHFSRGNSRRQVLAYYAVSDEGSAWVWFMVFDIQGWITLVIGGLLALINLFSFYSHASIPFIGTVEFNQQRLFR